MPSTVAIALGSVMVGFFFIALLSPKSETANKYGGDVRHFVQVLVLGDIGRSPRMQYHALSIAECDKPVQLIGYQESPLLEELANHPNVTVQPLTPPPRLLHLLPFIIAGPLKVLWQIFGLIVTLMSNDADWLLVQNPPSIPTLAISSLLCHAKGTKLLIDWHNYGWSILAGTRGTSHPFVKVSKLYESTMGRFAHANLTVTDAMAQQLRKPPYNIKNRIEVMHDRPAHLFKPMHEGPAGRQATLGRILDPQVANDVVQGRTRLVVSSTSWTPDEDFGLLLDALTQYANTPKPTPIVAVITGKGPQKSHFESRIAVLTEAGKLPHITIRTAFLPMRDYAALLASADVGVCLHKSSSGVDLPMKILDMFGAGLPVVAYEGYESFGELVREGVNGCGFETAADLAGVLGRLLGTDGKELGVLREGAEEESGRRWGGEWARVVAPLLGLVAPAGFLQGKMKEREKVEDEGW